MLDMKFVLENTDVVKRAVADREKAVDIDKLIAVYKELNTVKKDVESLRKIRNSSSEQINTLKKQGKDASTLIAEMKDVASKLKNEEPRLVELQNEFEKLRLTVPNLLDERANLIGNS